MRETTWIDALVSRPLVCFHFPLSSLSVQFSSVAQSCRTLCDPMNRSTPGLPVHHQLPEFTQTRVHPVSESLISQNLCPLPGTTAIPPLGPRFLTLDVLSFLKWPVMAHSLGGHLGFPNKGHRGALPASDTQPPARATPATPPVLTQDLGLSWKPESSLE